MYVYAYTNSSHASACMLEHAYAARVPETKERFSTLNLVLEKIPYHLVPPQTPIFLLYKAIKNTFSKEDEMVGKTHKIH